MSGRTAEDYADDYTDPGLRARLKGELKAGDRGGRPGQWSARKSQLLVTEYERQGGGYRHEGARTESQQHLQEWTEHGRPGPPPSSSTSRCPEARERVARMHGDSQLDRAREAEEHGRGRNTVLRAVEEQRDAD